MDLPLLQDLFVVLVVGAVVALAFERLRLPTLVGFLLTGVLVGPRGLALVADLHAIERLAELGVIVLLFTIGVELSLAELGRLWRAVLIGGGVQVLATAILTGGGAWMLGLAPGPALFVGFVVAMSSTAIVVRLLAERGETAAPHGRCALGILILQDLAVVPMMLLVPFLAGRGNGLGALVQTLGTAGAVVFATLIVARRVVPPLLVRVVGTRNRELFLMSVLAICLGTAWATSSVGLSLGLGAFLAGLVVSESEYAHHAFGVTLPFRDAFSALFFVSMGMLLEPAVVLAHPVALAALVGGVLVGKCVIVALVVRWLLGYPFRIGLLVGLLVSQVGEFSFLLIHEGAAVAVVAPAAQQLLIATTVVTMAVAPLVLRLAPGLSHWAASLAPRAGAGTAAPARADHVVIVGYGVNGRNVAHALRHAEVPYVVLELNPETVRSVAARGEPIVYGDATQAVALEHAGVATARVVVITVPDAASARRQVAQLRALNPRAHIIVRTRFVREVAELQKLGANEVVPEEFETSIEIMSRVLRSYLVPRETVEEVTHDLRAESYEMLRSWEVPRPRVSRTVGPFLRGVQLEVFRVGATSPVTGATLGASRLRERTGALVLAVQRGDATTPNPPASWTWAADDVALLLGTPEQVAGAGAMLRDA